MIETGRRLSLQYHERKDESIYVLSGRLLLHLEDDGGTVATMELGPGDGAHVPVGRSHRYEAIERVELIEVSTPELDDVIRVEDDFGREGTNAPYGPDCVRRFRHRARLRSSRPGGQAKAGGSTGASAPAGA